MRLGVRSLIGVAAITLCASSPALADRHYIERGETLEHIARQYDCSVEEIQRANGINTTLIRAGKTLKIPRCHHRRTRVAASEGKPKARRAKVEKRKAVAITVVEGQSIGKPWDGQLNDAARLRLGDGFKIRRPKRAWGASHVVAHVQRALGSIRDRFPKAHTLAIGDLSAREGGPISDHRSHQSGRDIDIGLYFTKVPDGYPDSFVDADENLDLKKTYYLIQAFAKTADEPTGVAKIYLDFRVQGRLYKWAKEHDVPTGYLDELFPDLPCEDGFIPSCDPTAGTAITVELEATVVGVEFALVPLGSIAGQVTDAVTGEPIPATVLVWGEDGELVTNDFGSDGFYHVGSLAAGQYYVGAVPFAPEHLGELYGGLPCTWGVCDPTQGTPVTVSLGAVTSNIEFELGAGGQITGRVTNTQGQPLSVRLTVADEIGRNVIGRHAA